MPPKHKPWPKPSNGFGKTTQRRCAETADDPVQCYSAIQSDWLTNRALKDGVCVSLKSGQLTRKTCRPASAA
jgi:hypothetical protein